RKGMMGQSQRREAMVAIKRQESASRKRVCGYAEGDRISCPLELLCISLYSGPLQIRKNRQSRGDGADLQWRIGWRSVLNESTCSIQVPGDKAPVEISPVMQLVNRHRPSLCEEAPPVQANRNHTAELCREILRCHCHQLP